MSVRTPLTPGTRWETIRGNEMSAVAFNLIRPDCFLIKKTIFDTGGTSAFKLTRKFPSFWVNLKQAYRWFWAKVGEIYFCEAQKKQCFPRSPGARDTAHDGGQSYYYYHAVLHTGSVCVTEVLLSVATKPRQIWSEQHNSCNFFASPKNIVLFC